jgi:hypothetical protein
MGTGEKQPMRVMESWNRNLMQLMVQSLELVSVYPKNEEETVHIFFCLTTPSF